jgi:hypothetical protein
MLKTLALPVRARSISPHVALAAFIILWFDVGVGTAIAERVPTLAKFAVTGLWLAIAIVRSPRFLGSFVVSAWPLVVLIGLVSVFDGRVAQAGQYIQGLSYLLIAFCLFCFYSKAAFRRERNALLLLMAADFVITGIRTVAAVQADPDIARYLATTQENRKAIYGAQSFEGLGGYGFAYVIGAVALMLLHVAVTNSKFRLPAGFAVVACVAIVFELGFTIAIILVLALGLVFCARDVFGRRFELPALALFVFGWAAGLYARALDTISQQAWVAEAVSVRLTELSDFLSGTSNPGTDLGTRVEHWSQSIGLIWEHGAFGIVGVPLEPMQTAGDHSSWLDLTANYGLGVGLMALFLVFAWRLARTRFPSSVMLMSRAWIYFVVLGFFNTLLFSTVVIAWMFFVPLAAAYLVRPSVKECLEVGGFRYA